MQCFSSVLTNLLCLDASVNFINQINFINHIIILDVSALVSFVCVCAASLIVAHLWKISLVEIKKHKLYAYNMQWLGPKNNEQKETMYLYCSVNSLLKC